MKVSIFIVLFFVSSFSFSQEICNNGVDDDFDGLIDLKDTTDCFCNKSVIDSSALHLIPNPSFEFRSCCPTWTSRMNCVNNWVNAGTSRSSDYYNTCGITSIGTTPAFFPPPSMPLPGGGNGYVGFYSQNTWEEYVGTCLSGTMTAGTSYTVSIYLAWSNGDSTFNFTIYGTPNCSDLPWTAATCPVGSGSWIQLATQAVVTPINGNWRQYSLTFTPSVNINAISFGGACGGKVGANYYFADELTLNKTANLFNPKAKIVDSGHYCQGNLILKARYDSLPLSFQWYKDSIAILGETDSSYRVPVGGLGKYQVKLVYDSGCLITNVFTVDTTIITFDIDSLGSCLNKQSGELTISNIRQGSSPFSYQLNSNPFVSDSIFDSLSPKNYSITVKDVNQCFATKSATVDAFPVPKANYLADSVCLGTQTNFKDISTVSSGAITGWEWFIGTNPTTQNTSYTFPSDGIYPVKLEVKSDSGCINDTTINVVVHPLPKVSFGFSPTEIYIFDPKVCFTNTSTGALSYVWNFDFSGTAGTSTLASPCTVTFPSERERTYRIKLIGISQQGCIDSTMLNLIIFNEFLLYIPNSFTPNGDNINDIFQVTSEGLLDFELTIFNRWGEEIFTTTDPNKGWNGQHKGELVQNDVYVYKVKVKSKNQTKELIGHVNLVR